MIDGETIIKVVLSVHDENSENPWVEIGLQAPKYDTTLTSLIATYLLVPNIVTVLKLSILGVQPLWIASKWGSKWFKMVQWFRLSILQV